MKQKLIRIDGQAENQNANQHAENSETSQREIGGLRKWEHQRDGETVRRSGRSLSAVSKTTELHKIAKNSRETRTISCVEYYMNGTARSDRHARWCERGRKFSLLDLVIFRELFRIVPRTSWVYS